MGMILSSCQKDNSLVPDDHYAQTVEDENSARHIDPKPGDDDVMMDPIRNYPDPFTKSTTLSFQVGKRTKVSLIVYNKNNERVAALIGEFLNEGNYRVEFDSGELPAGKYYAKLQVGNSLVVEEMTKVYSIHSGLPGAE